MSKTRLLFAVVVEGLDIVGDEGVEDVVEMYS